MKIDNAAKLCALQKIKIILFSVLEFELRTLHLPGRHSSWTLFSAIFTLSIFQTGSCVTLEPIWLQSFLCFPDSWDDSTTIPSFYSLQWDLVNFLLQQTWNLKPSDFCILTKWNYRHNPLHLAKNNYNYNIIILIIINISKVIVILSEQNTSCYELIVQLQNSTEI
jgi:hypothetical protein